MTKTKLQSIERGLLSLLSQISIEKNRIQAFKLQEGDKVRIKGMDNRLIWVVKHLPKKPNGRYGITQGGVLVYYADKNLTKFIKK